MRVATEERAGTGTALLRRGNAGFTGGAIGISGVHQGDAEAVLTALEVALPDDQWSGNYFVAGEHGSRGGRLVSHRACKIRLPAGFQTGAYSGKGEAARDLIITNERSGGRFSHVAFTLSRESKS